MRILHIIPSLIKGGAERITLDICSELALRPGVEVQLVLLRNQVEYENTCATLEVKIVPAAVRLSVLRKTTLQTGALQKLIEDFKPDVIHSHLFEAELVSRSVLYPNAAWFSHGHDNMIQLEPPQANTFFSKKGITNWWERRYLLQRYKMNGGSSFVAISKDVEAFFKRVLPAGLGKITLLPNAINVQRFLNPRGRQATGAGPFNLVNVGSFVAKKNQAFLVHVMEQLVDAGLDVHLTFLGDGPLRIEVQQLAKQLGLEERITFAGKVSDVETHLWQSDLYVHSALYEPFGLVLVEAMAAGLPVVSVDGRGNRDIIEQGVNGFIEPAEVTTFTARVMELMQDKELYARLAAQGLRTAEKYDIRCYVDQLLQLYSAAAADKKVRK